MTRKHRSLKLHNSLTILLYIFWGILIYKLLKGGYLLNIYDKFMYPLEKIVLSPIRKRLLPNAVGNVLEIGVGTGVNFTYYNYHNISSITLIDKRIPGVLRKRTPREAKVLEGNIECLPFEDNMFDTVVSTLVFCSINNVPKALSEVQRVLKDTGSFIFIEHVLSHNKFIAAVQRKINSLWLSISGGCNLNRETGKLFEKSSFLILPKYSSMDKILIWGIACNRCNFEKA